MTLKDDELSEEQNKMSILLGAKLVILGFPCTFTRVEQGPVISNFYFKAHPTSQLSKIIAKSEDLAMTLGVESLIITRVLNEVCVSVPNKVRSIIKFDECLFNLFKDKKMELPILMGKTTMGESFNIDLSTQPHILVAGSTGSGKSVFISQVITSLALAKSPAELKLVLVDTKQLDLTLFAELEHTVEMVDKIEDLYSVMSMLLKEVRTRTEKMKGVVRNIKEWNNGGFGKKMPYYILIIDELADVIAQDKELGKDEDKDDKRTRISKSLAMLAQISRAAGIHIIAATQRPSIQVISGDIKTNFPTRISFRLPTGTDSRVILDENGAENLLGKGDYLYRTASDSSLRRAHSAYVTMEDIARIIFQHDDIRKTMLQLQEQL